MSIETNSIVPVIEGEGHSDDERRSVGGQDDEDNEEEEEEEEDVFLCDTSEINWGMPSLALSPLHHPLCDTVSSIEFALILGEAGGELEEGEGGLAGSRVALCHNVTSIEFATTLEGGEECGESRGNEGGKGVEGAGEMEGGGEGEGERHVSAVESRRDLQASFAELLRTAETKVVVGQGVIAALELVCVRVVQRETEL